MDSINSTFTQNIAFIQEAIEEIVKPAENGNYSEDSQRLYRARKFNWIKALVEQVQSSKDAVSSASRCEVIVFLAINELRLVRFLTKFNKYEFFDWEKEMIKTLYDIAKSRNTTPENLADKITAALTADPIYAQEPNMLKYVLEELTGACNNIGLLEAEHSFKAAADRISLPEKK